MTDDESGGQSRTQRFRGETPPWRDDEWTISTVARRATNADETATCAVTDETVALNEPHYFFTVKRETIGRFQPEEYEHFIVAFEGGLEELERQIEINEPE